MKNNKNEEKTLEEVVNKLLEEQKKGNMVALSYKDKVFFSQSVTMDSAYLEVYGMTKASYDEMQIRKNELPKIDHIIITNIIERGKELIYPERLENFSNYLLNLIFETNYWEKLIASALDIMEMLENGDSIDDTLGVLLATHIDRDSLERVREIIFAFSKRGPEFYCHSTLNITPELKFMVDAKIKENLKLENKQNPNKSR